MTLIKTSTLNAVAVAVKVGSALVLNKILAVFVGPAGFAVIGQFQNINSVIVNLAGGVVATGVTKATAQYYDNEDRQCAIWKTAFRLSLISVLAMGLILLLLRDYLSVWLLHRGDMSSVFVWLAFALPAIACNTLLLAIINGKKDIGIYVSANIAGSLLVLLITGGLTLRFGLLGGLIAFAISPAITVIATVAMLRGRSWFKLASFWGNVDRGCLKEIKGFAAMALVSAFCAPLTQLAVRAHLTSRFGSDAAGYWQAAWKVSEMYLMMLTLTMNVYLLPRIAEIRYAGELRKEIIKVLCFVIPVAAVGALTIYTLRDFIVLKLFSKGFLPVRDLFAWQVMGDVVKMASWIFAYVLVGRAAFRFFIISEVVSSVIFVALVYGITPYIGLKGSVIAYFINYCIYLAMMGLGVRRVIARMPVESVIV
jgi:polysaccharide transporter, PST family